MADNKLDALVYLYSTLPPKYSGKPPGSHLQYRNRTTNPQGGNATFDPNFLPGEQILDDWIFIAARAAVGR